MQTSQFERMQQGRGSVLKRVNQFRPRAAMEYGLASKMYFTLPDYRYRSFDCLQLIDSLHGFQCPACQNLNPPQHQLDQQPSSSPPSSAPLWMHRSSGSKSASGSEAADAVDVSDESILPADISTSSEPLNLSLQRALPSNGRSYGFRRYDSASDAEDSRLANEAARCMNLQIRSHSCCPEWDPTDRCGSSGGRMTQSDSPYVASADDDDDSADVDLQVQWIKQETTDSAHSNGN